MAESFLGVANLRLSSSSSSPQCCSDPGRTLEVNCCFRGFLRGLGWRFWSSVDPVSRSPVMPGEEVADNVVDPDEELPASSFRLSGLGGGVSVEKRLFEIRV